MNFKVKKGEERVIIKTENGKAVLYFGYSNRYFREVKTDINADFDTPIYLNSNAWKSVAERIEFLKTKKMYLTTDIHTFLHLNDDKETNCFEVDCYSLFDDDMFKMSDSFVIVDDADLRNIKASRPFVNLDDNRYFLQVLHFTSDGVFVATDARAMSIIQEHSGFGKWLCQWTSEQDTCNYGNIFVNVFDCFDGKHDLKVTVSVSGAWLKLTDGETTVYTATDAKVRYPDWTHVIPDTAQFTEKTMINLKKFTDKKLLKSLSTYRGRVDITDGVAYTPDGIKLFEVGDILNGYAMTAKYLGNIAGLFGDSVKVSYNPENPNKCVVFGELHDDYALVMPITRD